MLARLASPARRAGGPLRALCPRAGPLRPLAARHQDRGHELPTPLPAPSVAAALGARGLRATRLLLESVTVPVPAMGEAVTQGDLVEWLKQPGDSVEVDEVICVIETDKVAVDIRSPTAGTLTKQLAKVEDTVNTDQPIAEIEVGDAAPKKKEEAASSEPAPEQGKAEAAAPEGEPVTVPVPAMGEAVTQGDLVEWIKQPGDSVEVDEVICVIETDKVAVDIRSPVAGTLTKQLASVEDTVHTDQPIAEIQPGSGGGASASSSSGGSSASESAPDASGASESAPSPPQHHDDDLEPLKKPMIHFRYGKRDAIDKDMGILPANSAKAIDYASESASAGGSSSSSSASSTPKTVRTDVKTSPGIPETTIEYLDDVPATFGRLPPLTEEEALRVQLGGADP